VVVVTGSALVQRDLDRGRVTSPGWLLVRRVASGGRVQRGELLIVEKSSGDRGVNRFSVSRGSACHVRVL